MKNNEYGLVLSGGGTKGAYQVGVWKALEEIGIDIKGITGASIGAINGILFIQNNFDAVIDLYKNIKITDIMKLDGINHEKDIFDLSNIMNVASSYRKQKGIDNTPLKNMLDKYIDVKKVYKSKIEFGLVTYSVKNKEPLEKFLSEIPVDELKTYLAATSCFPIFKPQIINGKEYFDGGLYDNSPANMLIKRGYKKIIIADVEGIGFSRKMLNKDVYVKVISPSEDLGGVFEFDNNRMMKNIKMGYLDTLKSFNKLQGHLYYFSPREFAKMYKNFNLQTIYSLEYAANVYGMERLKEYKFEEFIEMLYDKHIETEKLFNQFKNQNIFMLGKKLDKLFDKGFGICIAKHLYMDRPASKISNYLGKYVKDYIEAAKAIIELKNYLG